ncbi:RNA polymerase sigma factor [Seonamhaeicola maritimus]|uniref:RNA polymerase sigma factor n=1 Tax=Seonamhaeicola maritimus TaxID=2591822 RepID=UPI002493DE85|nr:RNA polymerase sigma-70 factor [Seonamhaeicola maritimus]
MKKGDQKAFEQVYSEYYEKLCVYLLSYTSDKEKVEDTVQDVFIKLWNKRKELTIRSSLKNYLYRAAYNMLMDKYRKQKRRDELLSSYYHTAVMRAIETDPSIKAEKIKKIKECIDLLPNKCKQVFMESKVTGLKRLEVAEKLNLSIKTVEGHITRAYSLIKKCMSF